VEKRTLMSQATMELTLVVYHGLSDEAKFQLIYDRLNDKEFVYEINFLFKKFISDF
jgi:hypothetical protein